MTFYKYKGLYYDDKEQTILSEDTVRKSIESILNNTFYLPNTSQLNDPTEGVFHNKLDLQILSFLNGVTSLSERQNYSEPIYNTAKELVSKIKNSGIFSLSKIYNDELMWAHYANRHNGIVIGYEKDLLLSELNKNNVKCFNINYISTPPLLGMQQMQIHTIDNYIKKYLGEKSKRWEYENEHRVLVKNLTGIAKHHKKAIKSIIFGVTVKDEVKKWIYEKIHSSKAHIKFYQMKIEPNSYVFSREAY